MIEKQPSHPFKSALIANAALSQLLIIDMQVKLAPVMPNLAMVLVSQNCAVLAQAANLLEVSVLLTEQYPAGLGATLPAIKQFIGSTQPVTKIAFSACNEPKFNSQLSRDRSQIIIAGMEAHICVLQTALSLINTGKQVFIVEDAIISRNELHKTNAIARLREAGCIVTNTESVLFEWIGNAHHQHAKAIFALIK